jgi:S-methylmethionine-dependent homocysteine/selenocysteine methylase/SAM-dependent methyltransferase
VSQSIQSAGGYGVIRAAIADQRCVVLDGGIATELPHRHGQDHERLWGIEALSTDLEEVRSMHRRYVDAGAEVITTNTWALGTVLEGDDSLRRAHHPPVHWMEAARRGVRVARQAIADGGREGECAVALSLNGDLDTAEGAETVALLARALAVDPPDLILLETLSVLRPSLFGLIEALVGTSIPVWVSFRRCVAGMCGVYGEHWGGPEGDAFGRAGRRLEEMGIDALLINCIPPDHVDGMVSYLRDFTDLPLGVYPNLGYYSDAGWRFETQIGGADYARLATRWREEGAQIIGGCCGTGPEHIAAVRAAVADQPPGHARRVGRQPAVADVPGGRSDPDWSDQRGRRLFPLAFPRLSRHPGVASAIPGSYQLWRHLYVEAAGAHQRCLDIGSGTGLQTVQLALNGATHVHAIDRDGAAVANTLDNALRNGVADRVTAAEVDIYPWLPDERYELIVANLPQVPIDPSLQLQTHRPTDYWGRGLVDQVISQLPAALAPEGRALITLTSLLSGEQTEELIRHTGLAAEVIAWEVADAPAFSDAHRAHLDNLERLSDAFHLSIGDSEAMVIYLLEIRHSSEPARGSLPQWDVG